MVPMKNKISMLLMEAGVSYNKQRLHKAGYTKCSWVTSGWKRRFRHSHLGEADLHEAVERLTGDSTGTKTSTRENKASRASLGATA